MTNQLRYWHLSITYHVTYCLLIGDTVIGVQVLGNGEDWT